MIVFHVDRPHIENSKVFRAGVAQPQLFFPPLKLRRGTHVCARSWVRAATARTFRTLIREGRLESWLWLALGGVDGASGSDFN